MSKDRTVNKVLKEELFSPMEYEAFIVGMLFGTIQCRFRLFNNKFRVGNASERAGLLSAEKLLLGLEKEIREDIRDNKARALFTMVKNKLENHLHFAPLHRFIRLTERAYSHKWNEEEVLERMTLGYKVKE